MKPDELFKKYGLAHASVSLHNGDAVEGNEVVWGYVSR